MTRRRWKWFWFAPAPLPSEPTARDLVASAARRTDEAEARLAEAEARRACRRDRRLLAIVHGKAGAA